MTAFMARIAVAAALLVVLIAFTACGWRYSYTERRLGGDTQPIRTDRFSGASEVLVIDSHGRSYWKPVLEYDAAMRVQAQEAKASRERSAAYAKWQEECRAHQPPPTQPARAATNDPWALLIEDLREDRRTMEGESVIEAWRIDPCNNPYMLP